MPRKTDKRVRLIEAAKVLIHQQGFHLTTLADIAQEADVPLGNVYYYFKTKEAIGEAAFYGPKVDIQVKTLSGKVITFATIQLDFLLPERFDLTYINENNEKVRPVMIHRGLISTYERLISILLEQFFIK